MKLGFGLITCQRHPRERRSDAELYAEALDLAVLAERLCFVDDAHLPSLMPMCAAIAARTERIEVGTALLLAPLYEPLRLAEDAAVVDLISSGRLVLGLGLGWREEEFEGLGVPLRERVGRLKDAVLVLRQAWAGELVTNGACPGIGASQSPARPHGPAGPRCGSRA